MFTSENTDEPVPADILANVAKTLERIGRPLAAQGAMGCAFRGDLEQLAAQLDRLKPDLVAEISAAAQLLSSEADLALARKAA
ncbi:hypothetical protein [Nonomuraea sediminis]|uniref:hypothetical protein n=1 Tax=Nonomuraea sediminis TaxID=2835864 RepID=UPI001BDBB9CE|nr:hypothetical protein [Nonomuraea sediminis]